MADWQQAERAAQRRALVAARDEVIALREQARGFKDDRGQRRAYTRVIQRLNGMIEDEGADTIDALLAAAFLGRERLIKEGFAPHDPTVKALNAAIAKAEGGAA